MKKLTYIATLMAMFVGSASLARADVPEPVDTPYPGTIKLSVDATDIGHRIFNVTEEIPAEAGPLTLLYPAWIPGHHSPTGPIDKVAGFEFKANGKVLEWQRDPANVYAFHINVPEGADKVTVSFKFLSPQSGNRGRVMMTPEMLNLQWDTVALYPAGYFARQIPFDANVTLPKDWHYATALEDKKHKGNHFSFKTIDFENLVDSPMFAGKYYKRVDLDPGAETPVHLNVFADKAKDLEISDAGLAAHKELIQQMYKLYGAHHYNHYDFLLALTDKLGGIGLEHHRSSENSGKENYFSEWDKSWLGRDLLAHEFNHSWNGKYRRPAGVWTPSYDQIKKDQGLWVYEGQTQFWGYIVATRAGLWNKDNAMDMLALLGATYDKGRPGMQWRNVLDTTNDPTIAQRAPLAYRNYQMSEDYYQGGQLIWYAVDAKLRNLSENKLSLRDFAKAFFGVNPGAWDVNTYEFDDVIATLNGIQKYDWASFINSRLKGHVNLSKSLQDQGWKLVYNDTPSDAVKALEGRRKYTDFTYSLGISVKKDGGLSDVLWDSPAFNAGLSPSMKLIAVNGEEYSGEVLQDAVKAAVKDKAPIKLLVKDFDKYQTLEIDYHEGLKYPHLVRIDDQPDYLSEILSPL